MKLRKLRAFQYLQGIISRGDRKEKGVMFYNSQVEIECLGDYIKEIERLRAEESEYKVYLYQQIREDEHTLFGFKTLDE